MINWSNVYKLSPGEFSEDPDKYADGRLIYGLGDLRQIIQSKMYPSPVDGALARFEGKTTSQHYVGNKDKPKRKSTGSDIFCEGIPLSNYSDVLSSGLFNGLGIYLDTKGPDGLPWVMFHVDIRPYGHTQSLPLIWIVEKVFDPSKEKKVNKYRYPQSEPVYWSLLNDTRIYHSKQFGS